MNTIPHTLALGPLVAKRGAARNGGGGSEGLVRAAGLVGRGGWAFLGWNARGSGGFSGLLLEEC